MSYLLKKVFPDHWSFMLGEIAMYCLIILLLTGHLPDLLVRPERGPGRLRRLVRAAQGRRRCREAYASTLDISFDVRGGLIIRQIHHWAALMFIVAIIGAHVPGVLHRRVPQAARDQLGHRRRPARCSRIVEGFAGYSLPDDLLSGTGLRVAEGFMRSIPVIGSYLSFFLFGGPFPGEAIIPRLYTVHVLLLPAIIVGLFTAHILLVFVHKHTQYPGPGRTNDNVVGYPFMPVYAAKAGGFFFIVFGVIAAAGRRSRTINPIWVYGPYDPSPVTAGAQPDWYMGFAEGALRLMPGWLEFIACGFTLSLNVFIPAHPADPGALRSAGAYPFLEAWVTGDKREHHLLDRPRNAPTRTGLGVMAHLTFYLVLFFAAWQRPDRDQAAPVDQRHHQHCCGSLSSSLPPLVLLGDQADLPGLQRRDRDLVLHGRETGRIVRTAEGKFFEVHEPLDEYDALEPGAARHARGAGAAGLGRRATASAARAPSQGASLRARSRASTSRTASTRSPRPSWPPPTTTVPRTRPYEAAPVWDRQLHGGADERPDTDAYAPHEHEHATEGALRERPGSRDHLDALTHAHHDGPSCSGRRGHRRLRSPPRRPPAWQAGSRGRDDARSSRRRWATPSTRYRPS